MNIQRITLLLLILYSITVHAAVPKSVNKFSKAIISVITYDKEGNILHSGNGFFISPDGTAVSEYAVFSDAFKAEIIDANGKKWPVTRIMGANEIYNLVKFKVAGDKSITALSTNVSTPNTTAQHFILPYTTEKKNVPISTTIEKSENTPDGNYYTLNVPYNSQHCNLPMVTEKGELVGIIQRNANEAETKSYAIGSAILSSLVIKPLSINNPALRKIHIQQALPNNESDAITYLYLLGQSADSTRYLTAATDFITAYPKRTEGYVERASFYANCGQYANCEADIEYALKISSDNKDQIHYTFGKIIYQQNLYSTDFDYKDWTLEKALKEAETAYQINPLPLYLILKGDCYFGMRNYEQAFQTYQEVNKSNIASAETFFYAANAKEKAGGTAEEIIVLLDSAIARYNTPYPKKAAPFFFERAKLHTKAGDYRKAVLDYNEYEHLIGYQNLNDHFYYLREQVELASKLYAQAIADIERAMLLNPKELTYQLEHAILMLRTNQNDAAIQSAQKVLKQQPDNSDANKILGLAWGEKGDKKQAVNYLKKASELGDEQAEEFIKQYK
jgi:tetratricopeptide (TPR) repeat protein